MITAQMRLADVTKHGWQVMLPLKNLGWWAPRRVSVPKKAVSLMGSSPCRDDPPKIEKWSQNRSRKKMGIMLGAPREVG